METTANGAEPTLSNYQLRLPSYEGPLDVLLRLIERSQLAIEDVSLVAVTDQFLAFAASMEEAPPAVIADFAAVGARLAVLKSRSLLPRPVVDEEEPEQSDLTYQLRAYQRVKQLASHLGEIHATGLVAHGPATAGAIARPVAGRPTRLSLHDPRSLAKSLRRRLTVIPRTPQFVRQRRVVSLRDVVNRVAELVTRSASVRFSHVVADYRTRTDVATAFLAVLVLVRRQSVEAVQGDLFADISLARGVSSPNDMRDTHSDFVN
jgi:segregation and condensation protein A